MAIENLAWVLPRPSKSKYIGGFPLHFEKKLLRELDISPETHKILHPFGGKAEFGIRLDLNKDVSPDIIADAHILPFEDNSFDIVICDPPYNEEYAKRLYNLPKPKFKTWVTESVRVLKENGYLVLYHFLALPSVENTLLEKRIFLETRVWHKLRCVHINKKNTEAWNKRREEQHG